MEDDLKKMEDNLKKMEDNLKKNEMEDDLKKKEKGRQPLLVYIWLILVLLCISAISVRYSELSPTC